MTSRGSRNSRPRVLLFVLFCCWGQLESEAPRPFDARWLKLEQQQVLAGKPRERVEPETTFDTRRFVAACSASHRQHLSSEAARARQGIMMTCGTVGINKLAATGPWSHELSTSSSHKRTYSSGLGRQFQGFWAESGFR
jgi:hypothetical protein